MTLREDLKNPNSHARSLTKALTWRVTATLTTAVIAYIVTGELSMAAMIGGIEFVATNSMPPIIAAIESSPVTM